MKKIGSLVVGLIFMIGGLPSTSMGQESAKELSVQALHECQKGRTAQVRHIRLAHFERGQTLAERAVKLDNQFADGHFALFCSLGEKLRLDGEFFSSVLGFRRIMSELDKTLALNPNHLDALSAKGTFLVRLPLLLGGDVESGERLLRRVIHEEPTAVNARLALAKSCDARGEHAEALKLAQQALNYAIEHQRHDFVSEAKSTLAELQKNSSQ